MQVQRLRGPEVRKLGGLEARKPVPPVWCLSGACTPPVPLARRLGSSVNVQGLVAYMHGARLLHKFLSVCMCLGRGPSKHQSNRANTRAKNKKPPKERKSLHDGQGDCFAHALHGLNASIDSTTPAGHLLIATVVHELILLVVHTAALVWKVRGGGTIGGEAENTICFSHMQAHMQMHTCYRQ